MTEEEKKAIVLLTELRGLYEATAEDHKFRSAWSIYVDEDDSDAIETILNLVEKNQNEIEELKKYDCRNIEINEDNKIYSFSFTKEELDLMNLGISLYIGIPKIFEENDQNDI